MTPPWPLRSDDAAASRWGERATFAAAILAVGALGAAFAIAFRLGLRAGFVALLGDENVLAAFGRLPSALRVLFPVLGGAAAGLVTALAARRPGYGVGEVLEAIVLPLVLATAVATATARQLRPTSVYTDELRRRGVAWEGSVTDRLARAVRARDILELDPPTVPAGAPVARALSLLREGRARRVYMLDGATIRAIDLNVARDLWAEAAAGSDHAAGRTAGSYATAVPVAAVDDTLFDLNEKLWSVDFGEIPVRDPADPSAVLGVVTRRALLGAFDRELLQRDMLLTRVVWSEGGHERADYLELPPGQRVEVVAPPAHLLGARISVGALRARYRVTLVGVQQGPRDEAAWRDPDDAKALRRGDRLLVIGDLAHINGLRKDVP